MFLLCCTLAGHSHKDRPKGKPSRRSLAQLKGFAGGGAPSRLLRDSPQTVAMGWRSTRPADNRRQLWRARNEAAEVGSLADRATSAQPLGGRGDERHGSRLSEANDPLLWPFAQISEPVALPEHELHATTEAAE
jgi:hypothetical protein